ncbi:Transmembrane and coiled-coil domain-containing protein 5B, partial [Ophiophagus hannah]
MLLAEQTSSSQSLQTVQSTLNMMQEMMVKMHELIAKNHDDKKTEMRTEIGDVKNEIHNLNIKIGEMQQKMLKNEQKLDIVEARTEKLEKRIEESEQNWKELCGEIYESDIYGARKGIFFLRFQNLMEDKKEDIRAVMINLIAVALQKPSSEIESEVDEVYKVHTQYAQKHKLPCEVHIHFAQKSTHDLLYMKTRDGPLFICMYPAEAPSNTPSPIFCPAFTTTKTVFWGENVRKTRRSMDLDKELDRIPIPKGLQKEIILKAIMLSCNRNSAPLIIQLTNFLKFAKSDWEQIGMHVY